VGETWHEGDQLGVVVGVGRVAVDGTLLDVGVGAPVAGLVGEDLGAALGTGVADRVLVGVLEAGGGVGLVVLLGWGLGLVGLSMTGAPSEGLVVAGVGMGRTQR
jgi:hypothetical protein